MSKDAHLKPDGHLSIGKGKVGSTCSNWQTPMFGVLWTILMFTAFDILKTVYFLLCQIFSLKKSANGGHLVNSS